MTRRVGVDAGGAFTEVCLLDDATGRVTMWKVASTQSVRVWPTQARPA